MSEDWGQIDAAGDLASVDAHSAQKRLFNTIAAVDNASDTLANKIEELDAIQTTENLKRSSALRTLQSRLVENRAAALEVLRKANQAAHHEKRPLSAAEFDGARHDLQHIINVTIEKTQPAPWLYANVSRRRKKK